MSESSALPAPATEIPEPVLERLTARASERSDRTLTLDEVMADLATSTVDVPTPAILELVKSALAEQGVTVDDSTPAADALTDEALIGVPLVRRSDEEVVVIVRDPVLDDEDGDDLVQRRHRARFRSTAGRDAIRLGNQVGAGGSSDPVRMYLKEIGRVSLLTAPEEVELAQIIERGTDAAEKLADLSASGQIDTLDFSERRRLERTVRRGEDAKAELTQANLRLVVSIAKRYVGRGMQILDLIQEGNLGLMRAVEKFDWTKGFKFSTYATSVSYTHLTLPTILRV